MNYKEIVKKHEHLVSYIKKDVYVPSGDSVMLSEANDVIIKTTTETLTKKTVKCGVVVALKDDTGDIKVGWSVCSDNDSFNANRGKAIAILRALSGKSSLDNVPKEFYTQVDMKSSALLGIATDVL